MPRIIDAKAAITSSRNRLSPACFSRKRVKPSPRPVEFRINITQPAPTTTKTSSTITRPAPPNEAISFLTVIRAPR
jgi:hypothetical protein